MKTDGYTKLVLSVIALALAVIAMRPVLSPTYSYAARSIEYKVLNARVLSPEQAETQLNAMGKQGWDVAAIFPGGGVVMKR